MRNDRSAEQFDRSPAKLLTRSDPHAEIVRAGGGESIGPEQELRNGAQTPMAKRTQNRPKWWETADCGRMGHGRNDELRIQNDESAAYRRKKNR